jgi:hypothetical protein
MENHHGAKKVSLGDIEAQQNVIRLSLGPGSIIIVSWITVEQLWLILESFRDSLWMLNFRPVS